MIVLKWWPISSLNQTKGAPPLFLLELDVSYVVCLAGGIVCELGGDVPCSGKFLLS